MVRFSDFITMDMDKVHGPKMPASHQESNAEAVQSEEDDIEKAMDAIAQDLL